MCTSVRKRGVRLSGDLWRHFDRKTKREAYPVPCGCREKASLFCGTLFFPLELLHVHTAIITKCNTFCFQQLPLVPPARGRASGMIHHPMTRVVSIIFCVGKNPSYQSCILLPPDEPGDLAVRGHLPFRNFFHHRQHFIDQMDCPYASIGKYAII